MNKINIKGTPGRGLLGTTLGFFFGFAAVSLYGPTAIKFKEAMDLTPAMMGLLVAIPLFQDPCFVFLSVHGLIPLGVKSHFLFC
jgi:hypothetical protein